jgi:hypothetical protein
VLATLLFYRRRENTKLLIFIFLGIVVAGLSGFRGSIITIILFSLTFFYLNGKIKFNKKMGLFLVFTLLIILLIIFLPYMPLTIQRSFAWLPFANISGEASKLAVGTSVWRITIWEYVLKYLLPQYLLIGKGLAFSLNDALPVKISEHYAWAIRTLNYHNGPLSLLVTLGLFGFVFFIGFFIIEIKRNYYLQKSSNWVSGELKHLHLVVLSYLITQFIFYLFVYGDLNNSIPSLLFLIGICEGLNASEKQFYQSFK